MFIDHTKMSGVASRAAMVRPAGPSKPPAWTSPNSTPRVQPFSPEQGDPFPRMVWPSNAAKLACATLFTLFFAGNDFAPHTTVDDQPSRTTCKGIISLPCKKSARRLKDLPNVIGYDSLNEPSAGWIGVSDLNQFPHPSRSAPAPAPFNPSCLALAIRKLSSLGDAAFRAKLLETETFNPLKQTVWLLGGNASEDQWRLGCESVRCAAPA